jgi:hypothetical protein
MYSNWIAVGMCNKKKVIDNKYKFPVEGGHGCYIISSNGGSWSNYESSNNRVVKSFHFKENDTILVEY